MTTPAETDLLIHYMPIIVRAPGLSDWERAFCISIVGRIKRGKFRPSAKQIEIMAKLVGNFKARTLTDSIASLVKDSTDD